MYCLPFSNINEYNNIDMQNQYTPNKDSQNKDDFMLLCISRTDDSHEEAVRNRKIHRWACFMLISFCV